MTPISDIALWERARAGDAGAFGALYERHARAVQAFFLWRTADPPLAEDLTSIVFLEAWGKRTRIAPTTATARPLLLGVATNVLRHHWRSRRRHAAAVARMRAAVPAAGGAGEDDDAIARVDAMRELRAAREAVRALPRRELDVLTLVAWGELTYEETAAALGVPVGSVRSRLARARARLGDAFDVPPPVPTPIEGRLT